MGLARERWKGHVPRKSVSYHNQKMTSAEYKRLKRVEAWEAEQKQAKEKQGSLL
jgi:hypothetical protein